MIDPKLITNNLISTNVSVIFYKEDEYGKISKFTKTLQNIKETASYEDIYAAATGISKLYDFDHYDVKLITTNLIENDVVNTTDEDNLETLEEMETEENTENETL